MTMPKAILALRSYPIALFAAILVFICTLLWAANSIGTITGGGDDEGSGLGGTGKSGDSGFGGTGGPRPVLGDAETSERSSASPGQDWPAPWMPRDSESRDEFVIPPDMQPLVELQRNPIENPMHLRTQQGDPDRLYILDDEASGRPAAVRQLLEMAGSDDELIAPTVLELRFQVPEGVLQSTEIETYQMDLAQQRESLPPTDEQVVADSLPQTEQDPADAMPHITAQPDAALQSNIVADADEQNTSGGGEIEAAGNLAPDDGSDQRSSPERIQRPELPPFQRMRPALDRASMGPPQIQPMSL